MRYNIEDCPGWLPFCAISIKLDNPGLLWSHMRLSIESQEMQMGYFGSLCDNDYLAYTIECATHLQLAMVMVFW